MTSFTILQSGIYIIVYVVKVTDASDFTAFLQWSETPDKNTMLCYKDFQVHYLSWKSIILLSLRRNTPSLRCNLRTAVNFL